MSETPRIHPTEAVAAGWQQVRRSPGSAVVLMVTALVGFGVLVAVSLMAAFIPGGTFLSLAASYLVAPAFAAGLLHYALRCVRGENPPNDALFAGFSRWWPVTGAYLILIGFSCVLIVPIVIAATVAGVAGALVSQGASSADQVARAVFVIFVLCAPLWVLMMWAGLRLTYLYLTPLEPDAPGAWLSFQRAWRLTAGSWWRMFGFQLLLGLVNLLGVLALLIGLLVTIPLSIFATVQLYDQLQRRAAAAPIANAPAPAPAAPPAVPQS